MQPAFKFSLNNKIVPGLVTIGKYDGKHPCLTCATSAGKVLIHNPHDLTEETPVRFLNINRKITSLCSGQFKPNEAHETLLVGTESNLLAYNVEKNADLFYKDLPDGAYAICFGRLPSLPDPIVFVGGNCSIHGFDIDGSEVFWSVAGDVVTSLAMSDVTGDGLSELLVGSEDYEIRAFQQEDVVYECTETDKILDLVHIKQTVFGFALANGTAGVYIGKHRQWHVKTKNMPVMLQAFDIDGDGEKELLIGWDNGTFEARRHEDGQILCKTTLPSPLAAIQVNDYRLDGKEAALCCMTNGTIHGFIQGDSMDSYTEYATVLAEEPEAEEKQVQQLTQEKTNLAQTLKNLEKNVKQMQTDNVSEIPSSTLVSVEALPNIKDGCLDLLITTNNDSIIRSVILFDFESGCFDGESLVHNPKSPSSSVIVPLHIPKNIDVEIQMKILVAPRGSSSNFHVFEEKYFLPKFAMFAEIKKSNRKAAPGVVSFPRPEGATKLGEWVRDSFVGVELDTDLDSFDIHFSSLRDKTLLMIELEANKVHIRTHDMRLAGDLVQDLCAYLELDELESTANFPQEMDRFKEATIKVDDFSSARVKLNAEMADNSNHVKNLIIRAEDSRLQYDMTTMKQMYAQLFTLNNALIGEFTKRSTNHAALLEALNEVKGMIALSARLRNGTSKAKVIKACRAAVKKNNIHALFHIIQTGDDEIP